MKLHRLSLLLFGILVLGLASACLPQGIQLPNDPSLSALARKSGRIVYLGNDGNVFVMDQVGGNEKQITTDATLTGEGTRRFYDYPAWSPDGKRIAFVKLQRDADGEASATLMTADKDGENLVEAFTEADQIPFYLYWSPDSQKVSFLASLTGSSDLLLQVVAADGSGSQIVDAGQPYYWSWSPDSKQMLVHVGGAEVSAGAHLSLLSLDGDVSESGLGHQPTFFQAPAFSPDGSRMLLAISTDDDQRALIVADAEGAEQSRITTFEGNIGFGWAADNQHIAFITGEPTTLGVVGKLTLADIRKPDEAKQVENEPVIAFFWAPDGKQLAYFVPQIVSPTSEPGQEASPGNEFLLLHLFVANASDGKSRLIESFSPTRDFYNILPYFDQYQHSATIWSPDSQNLVLSAFSGDGTPGIFVVHATGNLEPRFLKPGTLGLWSPK